MPWDSSVQCGVGQSASLFVVNTHPYVDIVQDFRCNLASFVSVLCPSAERAPEFTYLNSPLTCAEAASECTTDSCRRWVTHTTDKHTRTNAKGLVAGRENQS